MDTFSVALVLGYFLLLWLNTNAFGEYLMLFKITIFKMEEYSKLHKEGYGGTYLDFLGEYYNDLFLVRLVSCPICLSFWLGLGACLVLGFSQGILVAPLTLLFYLVFNKML